MRAAARLTRLIAASAPSARRIAPTAAATATRCCCTLPPLRLAGFPASRIQSLARTLTTTAMGSKTAAVTPSQIFAELESTPGSEIRLRWDVDPVSIVALADEAIARSTAIYDKVAGNKDNATWDNTIGLLLELERWEDLVSNICTFPQHVHTDKAVRDASTEAEEKLSKHGVEMSARYDVYEAVQAYAARGEALEGEDKRFFDRVMRDYRRCGMHLDADTRAKVLDLNKTITELEIRFEKHLGEEDTKLRFTREELGGMTEDFFEGLTQNEDGTYVVTLKYPHVVPITQYCEVEETRRIVEKHFNSRCKAENTPILERLIGLRHERAQLLGFENHVAYISDIRMAKTPATIKSFLESLSDRLTPLADNDRKLLLQMKEEHKKSRGEPVDGELHAWDLRFYYNMVEKKLFNVDHKAIQKYFPIDRVTEGLLKIYQNLLSLTFVEVKDAPTWHEDVQTFKVLDSRDNHLVGFFYLDMFPRPGKYGHAACFGLQPSYELGGDKGRQVPVAAMVCNFTKPTAKTPSLLTHSEVETFFHEFGHVCHQICSLARLPRFAGTRVERDFVEAPSQMLENWVWEQEALEQLSGRLEDGQTLPAELCEMLGKARNANAGMLYKRQVLLASFDQAIHRTNKADTQSLFAQLTEKICHYKVTEGTNMPASFGHIGRGYDSQYYSYLWSEVVSADMFETKFKNGGGVFDGKAGLEYREKILQPGGSKDAVDLLQDFLGRAHEQGAFLRSKGLGDSS